jgi:hypothetical protein
MEKDIHDENPQALSESPFRDDRVRDEARERNSAQNAQIGLTH